ncbi:OB-fold domain-containing protein [bacterium]|nr:OB-fold domain-containing protein [bacterium]MCI0604970.1 OB-fold domain-containing protein [bacterium]
MQITIRTCPVCGNKYLDDVDLCPSCLNVTPTERAQINGAGKIYSFSRVHVAPEQFKSIVPYYLAIIDLDEGPRLMARLQTQEGDHVRIDAPVELISVENGYVFALK